MSYKLFVSKKKIFKEVYISIPDEIKPLQKQVMLFLLLFRSHMKAYYVSSWYKKHANVSSLQLDIYLDLNSASCTEK